MTARVAVIGVGVMGQIHVENVRRISGVELVAVCDADTDKARSLADGLGIRSVADPLELIGQWDLDGVVVASSDDSHPDLVLACIAAGLPVLCEKPLALTLAEAQGVMTAETAHGRRLVQLGFMREFDPAHVAVRDVLRTGSIGRPVLFRGTHVNMDTAPFRMTGEEAIVKSMVHDIHSARFLTGREFVDVHARSIPAEDNPAYTRYVVVSATLDDGSIALLDTNMESNYGYAVNVEVVGTHGSVCTPQPMSAHVALRGVEGGTLSSGIATHWRERFADAYRIEAEAWVASLLAGEVTGPSCADGYSAQLIADACCQSLRTGSAVRVH